MARKELSDFDYDYQAYANYLESAECANDEGYDIYADYKGNIYEPTDGDWSKGHGHNNVNDPRPPRESNDPDSYGRSWKNPWLMYMENFNLTTNEVNLLKSLYGEELFNNQQKEKTLIKK